MKFLAHIQRALEETYGAHTGIDVRDFVKTLTGLDDHGKMLVEQKKGEDDLNLALLFDRDILAAWESRAAELPHLAVSVPFEEVSHFVYLSWNHGRGRNITALEMEMQSEVDRVLLAFHGKLEISTRNSDEILRHLFENPYSRADYEEARAAAARFVHQLSNGDPAAWSPREFTRLREFFHSDLAGKLELSRSGGVKR